MKAIILDDEIHCLNSLKIMCEKYSDLEIVHMFSDPVEALKSIKSIEADILFLDIRMPFINGFEFLQIFENYPWKVIFTTAYEEYALKALKVHAVDFLLKPIGREDLLAAVQQCKKLSKDEMQQKVSRSIKEQLDQRINKIVIPSISGLELIKANEIMYLKSDGNYTIFTKTDGSEILASKTLKSFESNLEGLGFLRIHHSYMVNVNTIKRYVKGDGGYVVMENDDHINVSRSRKDDLLNRINYQ